MKENPLLESINPFLSALSRKMFALKIPHSDPAIVSS
jgi:hypothetical protein